MNCKEFLRALTVNTHSSIRIACRGKVLYVDPFRLETAPHDADLIFLTHSHFDHFSTEAIDRVKKPGTVFVLPESIRAETAEQTAGHTVVAVQPEEAYSVLGIELRTVPAYNPAKPFHPRANNWVGYVLCLDGLRVYIAGDTDATEEAAGVACDAALLPIGGKYTMDPAQAAELANRIRPALVVPVHYGSVTGGAGDFERFAAALDPEIRVERVI